MSQRYLLVFVALFFLAGCTSSPASSPEANISSPNTTSPALNTSVPSSNASESSPLEKPLDPRLAARGGGIFNFADLTAENCDQFIIDYSETLELIEDDLQEIEQELAEEERDLQKARSDLQTALSAGNEHAADRARDDIDEEQEDVDYVEDLLEEKTEYFRKLKLIFATMKEECPKLKARA